jgi:hypothetical protein
VAFMAGIAHIGLAKHQPITQICNRAPLAQQLEVPAAVYRIAIQAGAYQLVILNDQFFVNPATGRIRVT